LHKHDEFIHYVIEPLEAALVLTNLKLSEAELRIHLLFVRTKAASNGCKKTLWKKKQVQVSDLNDKKLATLGSKKPNPQIR